MDTLRLIGSLWANIMIEGGVFMAIGALASGLMDAFLDRSIVARLPLRALPAALMGGLLGLLIPAGAPGSILVARRLLVKGAVPALAVAYLLGGPLLSLITLAGLAAAPVTPELVVVVVAVTLALALVGGLIWSLHPAPHLLLRQNVPARAQSLPPRAGLRHAGAVAAREIIEIGRWLVIGGLLAAVLGALITPEALDSRLESPAETVWGGFLLSVIHGTGPLANALDAPDIIARLGSGAAVTFLIGGAAVSLTRLIMLVAVFRWWIVLALALLASLIAGLAGALIALNTTL